MGEFKIKTDKSFYDRLNGDLHYEPLEISETEISLFNMIAEDNEPHKEDLDFTTPDNDPIDNPQPVTIKKKASIAFPLINKIISKFKNRKKENTKDGQIGITEQGGFGDCWLISAINALSYSEKGREIIKNILEYKDGGTLVHLKGVGDYFIPDELVSKARNSRYAKKDDDMIILELAVESALDDIATSNIIIYSEDETDEKYHYSNSYTDEKPSNRWNSILDLGNQSNTAMYIITGKLPKGYETGKNNTMILKDFEENKNQNMALCVAFDYDIEVKDINGVSKTICGQHQYTIKKVTDSTFTIVNPWASDIETEFYINCCVDKMHLYPLDLSDSNPERNFAIRPKVSTTYNEAGLKKEEYRDNDGNLLRSYEFNKKGKKTVRYDYNKDGSIRIKVEFSPKEEIKTYYQKTRNEDGSYEFYRNFDIKNPFAIETFYDCDGHILSDNYIIFDKHEDMKSLNHKVYNQDGKVIYEEITKYQDWECVYKEIIEYEIDGNVKNKRILQTPAD